MTEMDDNSLVDGFEGPEKRFELEFRVNSGDPTGLRAFTKEEWQVLLDTVKCAIVSHTSNAVMDSFVLSESSLFVYPYKIIIKTCGTTTLLNCVPLMKEYAAKRGTEIVKATYSRRNYNFPHKQPEPHNNFDLEIQLLKQHFPRGQALVMGPYLCGNHHFIYVWEGIRAQDDTNVPKKTVEILMSELDQDTMTQFFRNEKFVDAKTTTVTSGVSKLLRGMSNDELMFDPCGYSVNGICEEESSYYTIHVTPEAHCSFVSFETNSPQAIENFDEVVERVLQTFKPGRFHVIALGLSHGERIQSRGTYADYNTVYSSQSELHFSALSMKSYVHPEAKLVRD